MTDSFITTEAQNISHNILYSKLNYSLKEKRNSQNNNNTIIYSSFSKGRPEQKNRKFNDSSLLLEQKKKPQIQEEDIDYLKLFSEKNKNNYENNPNNRIRKSKFFYSNRIPTQPKPQPQKIVQRAISSNFTQIPQKVPNFSKNNTINISRRATSSETHSIKSKFNSSTERGVPPSVKGDMVGKNNIKIQKSFGSRNANINKKKIPLPMNGGLTSIHATVVKINKIKTDNKINNNGQHVNNKNDKVKIRNKGKEFYYRRNNYNPFNTLNGIYDNTNNTATELNLSYQIIPHQSKKNISESSLNNINNIIIEDKENIMPNINNNNSFNYNTILNHTRTTKLPLNMKLYRNNNTINKQNLQNNHNLTNYNQKQIKVSLTKINESNIKKQKNNQRNIGDFIIKNNSSYNNENKSTNINNTNNNEYRYSVINNYDDYLINDLIKDNINNIYQENHNNNLHQNENHQHLDQHNTSKLNKIPIPHKIKNSKIPLNNNINNNNNIIDQIETIERIEDNFNNINNNDYMHNTIQTIPNQAYNNINNIPKPEKIHFQKPIRKESISNPNKNNNNQNVTYNVFDASGWLKNYAVLTHPGVDKNGNQKTNQDSFVFKTNINHIKNFNIFGVLDGHGPEGHYVSQFASKYIPFQIMNHREIKNLKDPEEIYQKLKKNEYEIIDKIFLETDNQLLKVNFDASDSGCTCVLVINIGKHIICANTGDSRAILVYDSLLQNNTNDFIEVPLSYDYKPEMEEEKQRIEERGGVIEQIKNKDGEGIGPFRVWKKGEGYPGLAMSRSIGDLIGKKIGVIPNPGILEYELNESVKFIVVCSDGVWEFLNNDVVKNIGKKYYEKKDPNGFCHELVKGSYKIWKENGITVDDITAVVAFF